MVHAVMAALQPGEVLVLTMPEPAPVALFGDLLATQAKVHGAAAVLVDAAVRDSEELAEMGLPDLGALDPLARRDEGRASASSTSRSSSAAQEIRPGDLVVLDADGVTVVAAERAEEVLEASLAREAKEAAKRAKLEAGELSYELDGLREVEGGRGLVAGPGLHALAVELVQAALAVERLARLRDVVGERDGQRVAERQLDQRAHDRHVVGVRRQRVGGDHPAALGGELRRDVELVVVALLGELEGDERQLLRARLADQPERRPSRRSARASARVFRIIVSMM